MRFFTSNLIALLPLAACMPTQHPLGEDFEMIEYGNVEVDAKIENLIITGTGTNATTMAFEADYYAIFGADSSNRPMVYGSSTLRNTTAVNGAISAGSGSVQDVLLKGGVVQPVQSNSTTISETIYISNSKKSYLFEMNKIRLLTCKMQPAQGGAGGIRIQGTPMDYFIYKGRLVRMYKETAATSSLLLSFHQIHGISSDTENQSLFLVDALTNDLVATARIDKTMLGGKQVVTIHLMHINLFKSKLVLDGKYSKYFAPPPALISKCSA